MSGFWAGFGLYWKNYFNFAGRSTRAEFWWTFLGLTLMTGMIAAIRSYYPFAGVAIYRGYLALTFIPNLSQYARRFRDAGVTPWWVILTFGLPYVGVAINDVLPIYLQLSNIILIISDVVITTLPSRH